MALVNCPIRLFPVIEPQAALHFHWLNPKTHRRINMVPIDPVEGEVARSDLVKGYEYSKGKYVVMTDKDFERARIEATHTIDLTRFVPAQEIPSVYLDMPYVILPEGKDAEDVYQTLREAMLQEGLVALGTVVLGQREHPVVVFPEEKGLMLTTLRTVREVRRGLTKDLKAAKPSSDMVTIARQIMKGRKGHFNPAAFQDEYEETLRKVIQAKVKGRTYKVAAPEPRQGKVVNLEDALKKSLRAQQPRPAKRKRRAA